MKSILARSPRLLAALLLLPALVHAHPGHDGDHGLSWDFLADLSHRLTSPYHLFPVFAAAVALLVVLRALKAQYRDGSQK